MGVKELLPLGLILLGLAAGQYRVFENLSKHKASRYFYRHYVCFKCHSCMVSIWARSC